MKERIQFEELDLLLGDHAPFLDDLRDGPDNELHILVTAAGVGEKVDDETEHHPALQQILSKCRPIIPDEEMRFEICFENYIVYQVRNASFAAYDPKEIRRGNYLLYFEKSRLLERISSLTDAACFQDGSYFPGPWKHYGIYTQNHVVDVVSHCPPLVLRFKEVGSKNPAKRS